MDAQVREQLAAMRATRRARFAELAQLSDARMDAASTWSRGPANVRFLLLHLTDHEDDHRLQIAGLLGEAGIRQSGAQRLLGAAEVTRGELNGALVGLDDADLDLTPGGEWPLRRILAHILATERSYRLNVAHALELYRAGQPFAALDRAVIGPEPDLSGLGLAEIVAQLDEAREQTLAELADTPDADLAAPTIWAGRDMDVNFRLLRFADHEREHTQHILKWRAQVGRAPTEAQQLLALAWRARGVQAGQLVGLPDALLTQPYGVADVTIQALLEHVVGSEAYLQRQVGLAE
jgi:uncharacterized damage-inducible protein DinB